MFLLFHAIGAETREEEEKKKVVSSSQRTQGEAVGGRSQGEAGNRVEEWEIKGRKA